MQTEALNARQRYLLEASHTLQLGLGVSDVLVEEWMLAKKD